MPTFSQMLVSSQRNAHRGRGSCVVPCGSSCCQQGKCLFRLSETLTKAWFLCGSAWFQACPHPCKCLFRLSETLTGGVVPLWFHVVPAAASKANACFVSAKRSPRRGSCVVQRGSKHAHIRASACFVSAKRSPEAWFHVVPTICHYVGLREQHTVDTVPAWAHVLRTAPRRHGSSFQAHHIKVGLLGLSIFEFMHKLLCVAVSSGSQRRLFTP